MDRVVDIVKRGGRRPTEQFDRKKLHNSIVAACLSIHTPEEQAEAVARAVSDAVIIWLENHHEVTSSDLRIITTKHLKIHHPEAAYIYEQYRITI